MIESPYKADTLEDLVRNLTYAHSCVKDSLSRGEAPFAMHLFYPTFLDDRDPAQRAKGLACGLLCLRKADLVALYTDHGITSGMKLAEDMAKHHGITLEYRVLA
jgi:hypothetical protein